MKKLLFVFALLTVARWAWPASGGLIGNSPVSVASSGAWRSQMVGSYAQAPSADSPDNYFLLKPGEKRILLGTGVGRPDSSDSSDSILFQIGFDYGISDRWMWSSLTSVAYGIVNSGGHGHELAIFAGFGGLGYGTSTGLALAPTAELAYTFDWGDLRLISTLGFDSYWVTRSNDIRYWAARQRNVLAWSLTENLVLSVAAETATSDREIFVDTRLERERRTGYLFANPAVGLAWTLGGEHRIGATYQRITVGDRSHNWLLNYSVKWGGE